MNLKVQIFIRWFYIKDIANHFCNMSLDEILKLPNPEGYEFVDRFFDRAFPITEDFRSCKGELKMIPFVVWPKKVVVKQQDADKFNERRVKLIAKFIKDYKEIVKESFGDQASEVKTEEDFRSLQNQISYFSSIRNEEVVKE